MRNITPKPKEFRVDGVLIATAYTRVVVGQRGAYVEFRKNDLVKGVFELEPGQEYRLSE